MIDRAKAVLFDLDGTLIDTYDLIAASQVYATQTVLGRDIGVERLMSTVGMPLEAQMADYTDDPEVVNELCAVYREHNARVHDDLIKTFEGIESMLQGLRERGVPMGIVTSKRSDVALKGLKAFGYDRFMDCLVGGHDCEHHKPHPEPVLAGCAKLGVDPAECLYVGDSPFDIHAGNAAGCATVAVTWGMFSEGRLREAEPTHVIHKPVELIEWE